MATGRRQRSRPMADINVVPYIDVMLVLMVIFMVTAPMLTQTVQVDLPKANAKPLDKKDEPVTVSVKADGTYYVDVTDPKQAKSLDQVKGEVRAIIKNKPSTPVLVRGDHQVSYGVVVALMSALQEAGVPDVGLVTESPPVSGR